VSRIGGCGGPGGPPAGGPHQIRLGLEPGSAPPPPQPRAAARRAPVEHHWRGGGGRPPHLPPCFFARFGGPRTPLSGGSAVSRIRGSLGPVGPPEGGPFWVKLGFSLHTETEGRGTRRRCGSGADCPLGSGWWAEPPSTSEPICPEWGAPDPPEGGSAVSRIRGSLGPVGPPEGGPFWVQLGLDRGGPLELVCGARVEAAATDCPLGSGWWAEPPQYL
jgi:hypothetical protein